MNASPSPRALPAALVLFGIMAAHTMLETARDALFLIRLGPEQLAWAYLAIAGAALAAMAAQRRWARTADPRRVLLGFLVIAAIGTGVLGATVTLAAPVVFVLYVWTGVVATLVVPTFWTVIDRGLRIADARRMFAAIGAGGVLGALLGSALASALSVFIAPWALVWFAAGILALAAIAAAVLTPHTIQPPRATAIRGASRPAPPQRYLRVLLVAGLLSTVTLTLGDLMFKHALADYFDAGDLGTAFGAIYAGLNLLGLVIQLAVTPRLFDRLGVGSALTILPFVIVVSALGFVITGAVIAIVVLKLSDGAFRHSVHRVATEILFLPLSHSIRDATKPVIEAIGQRGGQAIAALIAFGITAGPGGTWWLGIVASLTGVAWLIAIAVTRAHYVEQFRQTIEAGTVQRDGIVPTLDGRTVSMLTTALSNPDESEALAALDLLGRRGDRIPALVLYHPSATVVRRALSLLDGTLRPDVERVLLHLTAHADPEIRASALSAASRTCCAREYLVAGLADLEPVVRAAAVVGLMLIGDDMTSELAALMSATATERAAVARAIGRGPREQFQPILDELIATREPTVTREVLRVWAKAPELADVEVLIAKLEDPKVRGEARRVLVADRGRYFDRLLAALEDSRTPLGVRRHLPRTISRYNSPAAATALLSRLFREPDGTTEFKILRALGRMRATSPSLPIEDSTVRSYILRTTDDIERYAALADRLALEPRAPALDASLDLLSTLLVEKRQHAIERVFRALGILHPTSDLRGLHDAITSDDQDRRSAAREILEELLPAALRLPVLAALSPISSRHYPSSEALFGALLADPSDSLRCIAAHHIAERRLVALRTELTRLRPYASALVGHAFDQAIARLDAR